MWEDNPLSAYLVLGLSNFGGGVAKGVTGFGSAIISLCTWIVFKSVGVQSGTLVQAVVTEALASTLIAPWLLYVTRAHQTADFRIVSAIALFVTLSSPVGAAVLAYIDASRVELIMGCALLAIILSEPAAACLRRLRGGAARDDGGAEGGRRRAQEPAAGKRADGAAEGVVVEAEAGSSGGGDCVVCVGTSEEGSSGGGGGGGGGGGEVGTGGGSGGAAWIPGGAAPAISGAADEEAAAGAAIGDDEPDLRRPLLVTDGDVTSGGAGAGAAGPGRGGRRGGGAGCCALSGGAKAWLRVLAIGSVAGTLSGVMEGLTGMNGPPIMIMYRALDTPKATVRGNNSWLNLLQFRLVPYYMMGLIVLKDVQLYGVTSAAGLAGVIVGDQLSKRMGQRVFQQVLGVLMVLCCVLMFASGLGLVA